jgi:hypothetical protein
VLPSAAYRADFGVEVTHVCSAFENTPKTKLACEAAVYIVKGEWLKECRRLHRRLPENDFCFSTPPLPPAAQASSAPAASRPHAQTSPGPPPVDTGNGGEDGRRPIKRPRLSPSPSVVKKEKDEDGDVQKVGAGSDVDSPAAIISKVTRVDDPVASLDLTDDSMESGGCGGASGLRGGSAGFHQELEKRIAASLKRDIADFVTYLNDCDDDVADVDDTAQKAVVEAWKVADEHLQDFIKEKRRGNPFNGFQDSWCGPLPQLLRDLVNDTDIGGGTSGGEAEIDAVELGKQVKMTMSSYENAVASLVIDSEVKGWVADDLSAFENFLRDTLDPEGGEDVNIADVARKGIVEALDMALKTWDDDGDFAAFHEQWEGPTPQGLKGITKSVEGGDAGMLVHLLVKEKLTAYRRAYHSVLNAP